MQKRVYMFLNIVSFNLLFFALYLNFIHKDAAAAVPLMLEATPTEAKAPAMFSAPAYVVKEKLNSGKAQKKLSPSKKDGEALRLSIN